MGRKRTAAELLAWPSQSESEGFAMLGVAAGRHAPTTVEELQERLRAKVRGAARLGGAGERGADALCCARV